MKASLSPKELAKAVGVSESSVKRWVDEGIIAASRTAGGHRRISLPEAIRYIRSHQATVVNPELLGLNELSSINIAEPTQSTDQLADYLVEGKSREARAILWSLYLGGEDPAGICDGPIRGAMERIGDLWHHGPDGIFYEHRATDICLQALTQIRLTIEPDESAPLALGGSVIYDQYTLPSLAASFVLASLQFRTMNLGANLPAQSLSTAIETHRPHVIWLSVNHVERAAEVSRDVEAVLEMAVASGAHLVVGGREQKSLDLAPSPHLIRCDTLSELAAFARGLRGAS